MPLSDKDLEEIRACLLQKKITDAYLDQFVRLLNAETPEEYLNHAADMINSATGLDKADALDDLKTTRCR